MGRTSLRTRQSRATSRPAAMIIQDRQEAIGLMNPRLRGKLEQIEKKYGDTRADNLRFYYDLGGTIGEIRNNPDQYAGTDGTSGIKLIERALSTQARTLRRAAAFREAYSPADFERLIGLQNTETNFQLHWGHVNYLLSIESAEQRWRFAADACSKMLSPPELHAYMKRRLGRARGHGRAHTIPPTLLGQVRQMETVTSVWNSKQAQVWDGEKTNVLSNLMEAGADDVNEDFLTHLKATRDGLLEMAENAAQDAKKLDRVIERVERMLEKQKQREAAAAKAEMHGDKQARGIDVPDGGTRRRARSAA
jgi:hypothetical protein